MRIAIVGPAYPLRGGIAHHVYWLWKELTRRGHLVQVISYKKLYPGLLFPGRTVYDISSNRLDASAQAILDSMNPVSWLEAFLLIRELSPDIVIFQWWNPFFAPVTGSLLRLLRMAHIPCAMECHNVMPHERTLWDTLLSRFAFKPLSNFITHSQDDRLTLLGLHPFANVLVSPLPTIEEFSSPTMPPRDGRTILFFGLIRKYKGVKILIHALPEVLKRVECNLLIIGEFYDSEQSYRELIQSLGLEATVQIENRYVPNEDVPTVLHRADVLVLPYQSATQSGIARLAIQNGLPIIASKTGGLSEVVEDGRTGFLFEPGNSSDLANKLVKYFTGELGPQFANNLRVNEESDVPNVADLIERIVPKWREGKRCD